MDNVIYDNLISAIQDNRENLWDACSAVWSLIRAKDEEEQERYFTLFLRDIDLYDVDIDDESHEKLKELQDGFLKVKDLEKRIIKSLISNNPTEASFYRQLWEKINDSLLFPNPVSQISFLACLWSDTRIPYFQLEEGLFMDDERYQAILEELSPYIKKANFIVSTDLQQRTQRASLLMKIAEEINDEEKVTVFWAYILSRVTFKIDRDQIFEIIKKKLLKESLHTEADKKTLD